MKINNMTTEEKAITYNKVVNKLRRFMKQGIDPLITKANVQDFFPELCESEDEKVRKALVDALNKNLGNGIEKYGITLNAALAWLEKQSKQKLIMFDEEDYNNIDPHFGKLINKIDPKFHEGDWIISNNKKSTYQVIEVKRGIYVIRDNADNHEYHIGIEECEKSGRLWTLDDAKPGDVLYFNNDISVFHSIGLFKRLAPKNEINGNTYRCYARYGGFNEENRLEIAQNNDELCHFGTEACPATKEQRDTLFTKMKEAGYEWDAEKKELKKVEKKSQRMISAEAKEAMYDKPTDEDMKEALQTEYEKGRADAIAEMQKEWSDKEKQMYADIIEATKKSGVFKEAYKRELVDWLKSLKDRYTWKPSDDQMRALEYIINNAHNTSYSCKIAKELLEQLKKLKGH